VEEDTNTDKILTDFYTPPHPEPHEIIAPPGPPIPMMYYDNDDGFWDEYIA
jgi:hypothetical protein